jgi:phosphoribosyl 1,2-cyclic phosphodiesterase
MKFFILASGSKGNAVLVSTKGLVFLFDFGMTKSRMVSLLEKTPYRLQDIDYVMFTHEHSDHAIGKEFIPLEKRFATAKTMEVLPSNSFTHYETKRFNEISVTAFPVSHDAKDPVGYVIDDGLSSLVYLTDTGYISEQNIRFLNDKTYYLVESNHNVKMLLQTNRSHDLKMRILGDTGHLSNEDSAMYVSEMLGKNTKAIYLMHLSEEANTPEVAVDTYKRMLRKFHIHQPHLTIQAAYQWDVLSGGDDEN